MASAFMLGPGISYALVSLIGGFAIVSVGYRAVGTRAFTSSSQFWTRWMWVTAGGEEVAGGVLTT